MPYVGVPPCEVLVSPKRQWQQTYVAKGGVGAEAAFKVYAEAKTVDGAGARAIHKRPNEAYPVITFGKGGCDR